MPCRINCLKVEYDVANTEHPVCRRDATSQRLLDELIRRIRNRRTELLDCHRPLVMVALNARSEQIGLVVNAALAQRDNMVECESTMNLASAVRAPAVRLVEDGIADTLLILPALYLVVFFCRHILCVDGAMKARSVIYSSVISPS